MPIPTRRRIEYAQGYLALGMTRQASAELKAIAKPDWDSLDVLRVRVDLAMETKRWKSVITLAARVCEASPESEGAWIARAYALHELGSTEQARAVLLEAEPIHGTHSAVLHYNLACYACVLGFMNEARRRLGTASAMDRAWLASALEDPDLEAMRPHIARLLQQPETI